MNHQHCRMCRLEVYQKWLEVLEVDQKFIRSTRSRLEIHQKYQKLYQKYQKWTRRLLEVTRSTRSRLDVYQQQTRSLLEVLEVNQKINNKLLVYTFSLLLVTFNKLPVHFQFTSSSYNDFLQPTSNKLLVYFQYF